MGNNIKSNTTFWAEINNYKIRVPYYQRDYAQGRTDGGRIDNIRKVFVEELYQAIKGKKQCHLGLVFGSYDTVNSTFIAVDGQQRLTTVFLLHWYVAWRENKLGDYQKLSMNFSWDTRSYSSQFVKLLFEIDKSMIDKSRNVINAITTHNNYFSIWENDPTVKGMLTMLEEIERQYPKSEDDLSQKLFSDDCNIRYDILKLEKNSDGKTYLKMNSRGRSLTTFELFKSKFIDEYKPSFANKFDNEWLAFMLRMSKDDKGHFADPDISFMNFINEYAYMLLKLINAETDDKFDKYRGFIYAKISNNLTDTPFISFEKYQKAFENKLVSFERFFDWVAVNYESIKIIDDECRFNDSRFFIDAIIKDNNPNYSHRTKLYAALKYAELSEYKTIDKKLYKRWTRVFRNLVANSDVDDNNFGRICKSVNQINNVDIYSYFNSRGALVAFEAAQVKEEIAKAKQILDEDGKLSQYEGNHKKEDGSIYQTWEEIINDAEKYAFFKGAIRFLYQKENCEPDWNRDSFDKKWGNAQKYFDDKGVKEDYRISLTKSLAIQCSDWNSQFYDKQIFNPNASTWKWILCSTIWNSQIHTILSDNDFNAIMKTNTLNDTNVDKYITPFLDNLPYKAFVEEEPTGRFRWIDGHLAYYKPYGRRYIMFDWGEFHRNAILRQITGITISSENREINDSKLSFWWGWNINFEYPKNGNSYYFQWNADGNIYLIENNERKKNADGTDYSFSAYGINDSDRIKDELDKLIYEVNTKSKHEQ